MCVRSEHYSAVQPPPLTLPAHSYGSSQHAHRHFTMREHTQTSEKYSPLTALIRKYLVRKSEKAEPIYAGLLFFLHPCAGRLCAGMGWGPVRSPVTLKHMVTFIHSNLLSASWNSERGRSYLKGGSFLSELR